MPIARLRLVTHLLPLALFLLGPSAAWSQAAKEAVAKGTTGTAKAAPQKGAQAPAPAAPPAVATAPVPDNVQRGLYLAKAGGCVGCHTIDAKDATPFAGGRPLKTPFGTFYGPNITPHPTAGIGKWSEADLHRALRMGERPDGAHYYPAFPYSSFTQMTDGDIRDLYAYLRTLPPSPRASQPHDLRFPSNWRFLMLGWKWLFFTPGPAIADARHTTVVSRGAYLTNALGHCGECHTPRNVFGGSKKDRLLAGTKDGPEGKSIPNLTPARLKKWSDAELKEVLQTGNTPDFDSVNATMAEVVRNTTSQLTDADLAAMIAYLRSIPALPEESK